MADVFDVTDDNALTTLCRDLFKLWRSRTALTPGQRRNEALSVPKFAVVHGLTAHTYRLGQHITDMFEDRLVLEAIPLVRLSYESALTAHWIAQNIDGAEAFVNRDLISRRAAATTLRKASAPLLREAADGIERSSDPLHPTGSLAQARNFEQLCDDLRPGGADAYAYYRLMSWFSHPSNHIVDRYLEPDSEESTGLGSLRLDPSADEPTTWRFFVALSLLWSARAVDFLDADRTHRSELRSAARQLGVPPELHLTSKARLRTEQVARDARLAARRGKRPRREQSS